MCVFIYFYLLICDTLSLPPFFLASLHLLKRICYFYSLTHICMYLKKNCCCWQEHGWEHQVVPEGVGWWWLCILVLVAAKHLKGWMAMWNIRVGRRKCRGVVVRMSSKNRNVYGIISRDQGVIRAGSWDCWIQVMRISMRPRLAWKDPSSKQPIVK